MTDETQLVKHCPYCRRSVLIVMGQLSGSCTRCLKPYIVKYHLSKIRLNKVFVPRDYETEILRFILRKQKTYSVEITSQLGVSKGKVSVTLRALEEKNLISSYQRGRTRWVEPIVLPAADINIK